LFYVDIDQIALGGLASRGPAGKVKEWRHCCEILRIPLGAVICLSNVRLQRNLSMLWVVRA